VSTRRRLSAVALLLAVIAVALGAATTASAGAGGGSSPARPATAAPAACRGRVIRASAPGTCTTSVVAQADVARSATPTRRASAGAWTAVPRPALHGLAAMVETGGVTTCPRPPPGDNHSRAPPTP
jgi:hypothetical protein